MVGKLFHRINASMNNKETKMSISVPTGRQHVLRVPEDARLLRGRICEIPCILLPAPGAAVCVRVLPDIGARAQRPQE
ncbi:MAG: hypothetical protein NUV63_01515 [Gallionella sp.]|nr:hypothetical protein [Gallionella sp.]